jgi:plasmid stabilization system protein ParE
MFTMNASAGTSHSHVKPPCCGRLEPEPRIELRVPDDNDERTAAVRKTLDATCHELAANALSLTRRSDRHRPERRTHERAHGQWTEHDVADDHTIGNRDK